MHSIPSDPLIKKENYIKRCVGIPGDIIEIKNADLYVNGEPQQISEKMKNQFRYYVKTDGTMFSERTLKNIISTKDKCFHEMAIMN